MLLIFLTESMIAYFNREFKEDLLEASAQTLHRIGDEKAINALTSALDHNDRAKSKAAVKTLAGSKKIPDNLKEKVQSMKKEFDTQINEEQSRSNEDKENAVGKRTCNNCKVLLEGNELFCAQCGTKIMHKTTERTAIKSSCIQLFYKWRVKWLCHWPPVILS